MRNLRQARVVALPRREQARFRRRATVTLVLASTLGGALAAYATANNRADFTPVSIAVGAVPLLGGFIGLWRLIAAWEAGPGRQHAVLAAFSLGLLGWAMAAVMYLISRAFFGSPTLEFPSAIDIPNFVSALAWTVGVWMLYEGAVDDFLTEIAANSYFLTLIAVGCFFVLTVAYGKDYGQILWSGDALARHITEGLLPLAWGVNAFLLFRATRGHLGKRLQADRKALLALAFGLGLACVSDLLFDVGARLFDRDPASFLAYRNGGVADMVAMAAYFWLSFGLLHFPLDAPLYRRADA